MINRKIHNDYIKRNGSIEISTYGIFFHSKERRFLAKYYKWGLGLVNGKLHPISEEQDYFIRIFHKHVKYSKIPPKKKDEWYAILDEYQKTWIRYYYVEQLKENINDYTISKDAQNIFFNEDDVDAVIAGKRMSNKDVDDSNFCAKCGNFKGLTKYHFCSNCRISKPKKKKLKRGSITTNRSSFSGRKWNDDKHRNNHNRSSLDRDL